MNLAKLACKRVQELTPYQSARRIGGVGRVYLNANESPEATAFALDPSVYNRYPECQPPELLEAYAAYAGVNPQQVIVARGSDEIIGLLCRAFCEPGREAVLICPPTYGMYSIAAETNGIETLKADPDENFQPDCDAIEKILDRKPVKALFLCSPNNPTGTLLERDRLIRLLEKTQGRALVVVDEAYIEFASEHTFVDLLEQYRHLVITRTLSKAFGLAGLRCGFALADPEVVSLLLKVIDPYPICAPVAQVAAEALKPENVEIMRRRVTELNGIRNEFLEKCSKLSFVTASFDCNGNYVLLRFKDGNGIFEAARKAGFILRNFDDKPRLKDCVRITVGSRAEMDDLYAFLKEQEK
ncbi:MAG: histidinol-phosphate transaminase [Succinivibrionaceae bacterium]|nr:histidinol-phosphate transaminase [Succinivibrionaceae bacterium]